MSDPPLHSQATWKKLPGTLSLTPTAVTFTLPTSPSSHPPQVSIPLDSLTALFASKPGGARTMLKLQFTPSTTSIPQSLQDAHSFVFTSPTSHLQDRDRFKDHLSRTVAHNREREANKASTAAAAAATPSTAPSASLDGNAQTLDAPAGSASPAPTTAAPTTNPSTSSSQDQQTYRLRKHLLRTTPSLLTLHRDLVLSGALTEAEFWSTPDRTALLSALAAEESLMKGKSGEMVDPKTVTGQNGQVTVKVTPGLIREIFEEFPVVLRAYNENVPEPLSEPLFWTRYFQSRLFNRNRTTNRAAVSSIKDDSIFDMYLGIEDDLPEPQIEFDQERVGRLLDLKATEEDQHEIPNLPSDYTMKPGGQRASLPLMRRFNEHSERLLNQALGEGNAKEARERGYVNPGNAGDRSYYSSISLSDLSTPSLPERISLTLTNNNSSSTSTSTSIGSGQAGKAATAGAWGGEGQGEGDGEGNGTETLEDRFEKKKREREVREEIEDQWQGRLGEFQVDSRAVREAMRDMTESVGEQVERTRKTGGGALPRHHLTTLTSLSTTTYEFLRHFYSALLPPPASLPLSQHPTAGERAARVTKFKGYIEKSLERIGRAVEEAQLEGESQNARGAGGGGGGEMAKRVKEGLRPVREACEVAVKEWERRMGTGTGTGANGGARRATPALVGSTARGSTPTVAT